MDIEVLNLTADTTAVDRAARSLEILDRRLDAVDKTILKTTDANKILRGELIEVSGRVVRVSDSLTKSQASMLATMKLAGASAKEIKYLSSQFESMNKIMGLNTFDKSANALSRMRKQTEELSKSQKYIQQYNDLTKQQISLLTQGIEATRQRAASEKMSFGQRESAVKKFINEFVKEAQAYNQITASIEEKNRAAKEEIRIAQERARAEQVSAKQRADAEKYVQEQLAKTLFITKQMEGGMSTSGANALYAYKQQLDMLGLSADQAEKQLLEFQNALSMKQAISSKRNPLNELNGQMKQTRQEVNQLARAVSVQMGDVAVSLAGGMNPFLVAIQQGDQIRFALEQAKAAGQSLDGVMKGAVASMANSFVLVGQVIGSFVVDGLQSAGKAAVSLGLTMTGTKGWVESVSSSLSIAAANGDKFASAMLRIGTVLKFSVGALVAFAGIVGGMYLTALIQADNMQTKLAQSIGRYGASLGVTIDQAMQFAQESEKSTSKFVAATVAISKAGGFTRDQLIMVAESAIEMNKVFGISIEDVVGEFKKLQDDPVKGLLELQRQTGNVNQELIKTVDALVRQGNQYDAVKLAMSGYADANKRTTDQTIENLGLIETILSRMASAWSKFYKDVQNFGKTAISEQVEAAKKELETYMKMAESDTTGFYDIQVEEARKKLNSLATALIANSDAAVEVRKEQSQLAEWQLKNADTLNKAYSKEAEYLKELYRLQNEYAEGVKRGASLENLAQIQQAMNKLTEDFNKKDKEKSSPIERYFERIAEKVRDLGITVQDEYNSMNEATTGLTKSQKMMLDLIDDPKFVKLSNSEKSSLLNTLAKISANEELIKTEKAKYEVMEMQADLQKTLNSNQETIEEETRSIKLRLDLLGKTEDEAKAIQRQYDLNTKLAGIENKYIEQRNELIGKYIKLVKEGQVDLALQMYKPAAEELARQEAEERRLAGVEANSKIVDDYAEKFKEVQKELSDIAATFLFDGFKEGVDSLKDYLKRAFKNYVIKMYIDPVIGQIMGAAVGGIQGGAQSGSSNFNNLGSTISGGLESLGFNALNKGWTSTGESLINLGNTVGKFDTWLKDIPGFGGGLSSVGGYASALMSFAKGDYGSGIGAAIGTAIAPGIGTFIGQTLGSLVGGMFGSRSYHSGAAVGIGADNVISSLGHKQAFGDTRVWGGFSETDMKGGSAFKDPLTALAKGVTDTIEGTLSAFGIGGQVSAYAAFGADGKDASRGALRIYDALGNLISANSDQLLRGAKYSKDAEKGFAEFAADAGKVVRDALINADLPLWVDSILKSLGDSVTVDQLNQVIGVIQELTGKLDSTSPFARAVGNLVGSFESLGLKIPNTVEGFRLVLESSGDLGDELFALAPAFIELINTQKQMYDALYTEEEAFANASKELLKRFSDLGVAVPSARDQFRNLIDSIDATTKAGAMQKAQLLELIPAWIEYNDRLKEQAEIAKKAAEDLDKTLLKKVDDAFNVLKKAVETEKSIVQKRVDSLSENLSKLRKVFDFLKGQISSLLGSASSTKSMQVSSARNLIDQVLISGVIPSDSDFEDAVKIAVRGVEDGLYATKSEQEKAKIILANNLTKINSSIGDQIDTQELLLSIEKRELERLDGILLKAQEQINALNGINSSVISVELAIKELAAALLDLQQARLKSASDIAAPYVAVQSSIAKGYSASGGNVSMSVASPVSSSEQQIASIYQSVLGRAPDAGGLGYWASSGLSTSQIEQSIRQSAEAAAKSISTEVQNAFLNDLASSLGQVSGVSAYASGGVFTNGVVTSPVMFNNSIMGEAGPEAILPLTNIGGSLGVRALSDNTDSTSLLDCMDALRAEVAMLRAETRAVVTNTSKAARILDDVTEGGTSVRVDQV